MKFIEEENKEKALVGFDGTPAEVMKKTLKFIRENWASVEVYLHSVCGFKFSEQHTLRKNMLDMTTEQTAIIDSLFPAYKRLLKAERERVDKKGLYLLSKHGKKLYLKTPLYMDGGGSKIGSNDLAFILIHRRSVYHKVSICNSSKTSHLSREDH